MKNKPNDDFFSNAEHIRTLVDNLPHGAVYRLIHSADGNRRFEYVSKGMEKLFGISAEILCNDATPLYGMVVSEDVKDALEKEKRAAESISPFHHICRIKVYDGSVRWIEWNSMPMSDNQGGIIWDGVCLDVTDQIRAEEALKRSENALRSSENKFRAVSDFLLDAIIMMDERGAISFWNKAAEKMFGYSEAEAIGKDLHDTICPARYREKYKAGIKRFLETGEGNAVGKPLELTAMRRDDTEFPIEISVSAVKRENLWNSVAVIRDITARKLSEKEKTQSLIRHIFDAIIVTDDAGKIIFQNDSAENIFGYSNEESLNSVIIERVHPEDRNKAQKDFARIAAAKSANKTMVCRVKRKDGELRIIETNAVNISEKEDEIKILLDCRDVTERYKTMEEIHRLADDFKKANVELRTANEKLKSAEIRRKEFFVAIGHELRSPIAVTIGAIESLLSEFSKRKEKIFEREGKLAEIVRRNLQRLSRLIENLLDLARAENEELHVTKIKLDLVPIALSAVESFKPLAIRAERSILFESSESSILVYADADKLHQIMGNLLGNAIRFANKIISVKLSIESDYALIEVIDDGEGIGEKCLPRIFEKYYRADTAGKKSHIGLGLSIVKLLAEAHGGSAIVENTGSGAKFGVRIPLAKNA